MNIAVAENIDFLPQQCLQDLQTYGQVVFGETKSKTADVLIVKRTKVTRELLDHFPHLKYIITLTIGTGHIDSTFAASRGIRILNCPTYNHHAVVEHTFALLLAACRHITESNLLLRKKAWKSNPDAFQGIELAGKHLVVIGNGHIGHEVAKRAKCFTMQVETITSQTSHATFVKLLRTADFITLHVPLTDKTYHLLNAKVLKLLKKSVLIINTCKNEIIEEVALLNALKEQKIGGCALDVFENDPVTGNLSAAMQAIIEQPNVIATPHVAFNTKEANIRLGNELLAHIQSISS